MGSGYNIGDVVLVHYPYKEDPSITKLRPAVIVDITETPILLFVQITSTNRSDTNDGRWIVSTSNAGKMMGLRKDSFLNYGNFLKLDFQFIYRKIGTCPYIDEIKRHL